MFFCCPLVVSLSLTLSHRPSPRVLADRIGEVSGAFSYNFAKDRSHIYFQGKEIKEADYNSFRVVHAPGLGNDEYGIDRAGAFYESPGNGKLTRISHSDLPIEIENYLSDKKVL